MRYGYCPSSEGVPEEPIMIPHKVRVYVTAEYETTVLLPANEYEEGVYMGDTDNIKDQLGAIPADKLTNIEIEDLDY